MQISKFYSHGSYFLHFGAKIVHKCSKIGQKYPKTHLDPLPISAVVLQNVTDKSCLVCVNSEKSWLWNLFWYLLTWSVPYLDKTNMWIQFWIRKTDMIPLSNFPNKISILWGIMNNPSNSNWTTKNEPCWWISSK